MSTQKLFILLYWNMAKDKIAYVCSNCGQDSPKWIGRCPNCGQWNTFKEIRIASDSGSSIAQSLNSAISSKKIEADYITAGWKRVEMTTRQFLTFVTDRT
jgi:predicted ATP-dependent serine protease